MSDLLQELGSPVQSGSYTDDSGAEHFACFDHVSDQYASLDTDSLDIFYKRMQAPKRAGELRDNLLGFSRRQRTERSAPELIVLIAGDGLTWPRIKEHFPKVNSGALSETYGSVLVTWTTA